MASVAQKLSLVLVFLSGVFSMAFGMRLLLYAPASSPNYTLLISNACHRAHKLKGPSLLESAIELNCFYDIHISPTVISLLHDRKGQYLR